MSSDIWVPSLVCFHPEQLFHSIVDFPLKKSSGNSLPFRLYSVTIFLPNLKLLTNRKEGNQVRTVGENHTHTALLVDGSTSPLVVSPLLPVCLLAWLSVQAFSRKSLKRLLHLEFPTLQTVRSPVSPLLPFSLIFVITVQSGHAQLTWSEHFRKVY